MPNDSLGIALIDALSTALATTEAQFAIVFAVTVLLFELLAAGALVLLRRGYLHKSVRIQDRFQPHSVLYSDAHCNHTWRCYERGADERLSLPTWSALSADVSASWSR